MFRILICGLLFFLSACSIPFVERESPEAKVTSFNILPADGPAPRFEIGLHVSNPTWLPLEMKGMTYHVEIDGHMLLSGEVSDLPEIESYNEQELFIEVSMSIYNSTKLFNELLEEQPELLTYTLIAKLDLGVLRPSIRIKKSGKINLFPPPQ